MLKKLPVSSFERLKISSQFNNHSIQNGMKTVIQDIFLNLMFNILKDNMRSTMIYNCYQKV